MLTDKISYILTKIKNAAKVKHETVIFPFTKNFLSISRILKQEGFIKDFRISQKNKKIIILLKYKRISNNSTFKEIKQISKPSLHIYTSFNDISKKIDQIGITLISTPKGILTNKEAKKLHIGGEILCYIL
uniref:Ribosomal protein S8 n=1 Tax=Nitzschia sp. NIES-3576 TaxID=2083273 RepID=A0A2Z5ZBA3_9STRA|nr:ribosomal protein S8 [Nitzschia sp. NIES-3576]